MIRNIRKVMAIASAILAFTLASTAAKAQSFTGNYPVLETQVEAGIAGNIKGGNQSFCLTLTDDGSFGRPHSGTAVLTSSFGVGQDSSTLSRGEFYVIGKMIFVNFAVASDTAEDEGLVIAAPANASKGEIGTGVMGLAGGVPSSGLATVGEKNGC